MTLFIQKACGAPDAFHRLGGQGRMIRTHGSAGHNRQLVLRLKGICVDLGERLSFAAPPIQGGQGKVRSIEGTQVVFVSVPASAVVKCRPPKWKEVLCLNPWPKAHDVLTVYNVSD